MTRRKGKDSSAYWNHILESKRGYGGEARENVEANPDFLSESSRLVRPSTLSDDQEEALATYYRLVSKGLLKNLSPRQKEIWKLRFFKWCSEEEIAKKLGLSLSAIRSHLDRAGDKIREAIKTDQEKKDRYHFNDGFKKGVHEVGETHTDRDMEARLRGAKEDVDSFYRNHPEINKNL